MNYRKSLFKKIIFALLVLLGIGVIWNFQKLKLAYKYYICPCFYDTAAPQTDFQQVFLPINLDEYYQKISISAKGRFAIDTLALIPYQDKAYPVLQIENTTSAQAKNKLLLIAGVHGNEVGGVLAIPELLETLDKNPALMHYWQLKIITPLNPVGVIEKSRYNQNGCDVNRKLSSSTETEVVLQRNLLDNFKPDVVISFHESPANGFLLHSNELLEETLLQTILKDVELEGIALAKTDYLGRALPVAGNSPIGGSLKVLNKILNVDALGDYASTQNCVEITTESHWNTQDIHQRVQPHVTTVLSVMRNYD